MLRRIIIVIFALLCFIARQSISEPSNKTIFSRIIETRLPNPVTLAMGSDLYTISHTAKTLRVNSTSRVNCTLDLAQWNEVIQGRINAIAFESIKAIAVWGIQQMYYEDAIRTIYYTLLLVDTKTCKYKNVPLPEEKVPSSWPTILPQIVVVDVAYFIVYPSQQQCDPCLYWYYTGKDPNWQNHMSHHDGVPSSQFHLKLYTPFFPNDNVFYAYNFANDTTLVQYVDVTYFKYGSSLLLNTTVDAASVSYGHRANTVICSISVSNRRVVECMRLNENILVIDQSWKLPVKDGLPVADVSVVVDKVGNTFIGVLYWEELRLFIYNVDAQLVADLNFGKLEEKHSVREVNGIQLGTEFCLVAVVHSVSDRDAQHVQHVVKCIEVSKYLHGMYGNAPYAIVLS